MGVLPIATGDVQHRAVQLLQHRVIRPPDAGVLGVGAACPRQGRQGRNDFTTDPTELRLLGRMPGQTFCTKVNVVPRAAKPADPNAGIRSSVVWLGDER
jgi:hypothetical protein